MAQKRPSYVAMRLIKRLSVYVFFVAFSLAFWWLAENSGGPWQHYFASSSVAAQENATLKKGGPSEDEGALGSKTLERVADRILKGEGLSAALARHHFSSQEAHLIANIFKSEVNLKQIRPGDVFIIERGAQSIANGLSFEAFELIRNDPQGLPLRWRIQPKNTSLVLNAGHLRSEQDYELRRFETPVAIHQGSLVGTIESSLYDGIIYAGGDATLVNQFSEIFGWQVDFYRETQRGDGFKMLVESKYADGRFVGYGRVKAAEYARGGKIYRGFYYKSADGKTSGTYDENGVSLEKSFLKSPVELARITSRYGQRFHPILRQQKKHNGIDYGASVGTPFWAVADGVVLEARYSPTAGNMIRIKHRNGYVTEYFHASKIAPGVRAGATVRQKQVIGYVGTTGRSTGPHLHFGMMADNKQYVDPSRQNFPTGQALPNRELALYKASIQPLLAELGRTPANNS